MNNKTLILGSFILLFILVNGCKSDETVSKIKIQFKAGTAVLSEGSQVKVILTLEKPAKKQEYVTLKLSSTDAVYGTDFTIDNAVNLANTFSLTIPKDSLSVSFSMLAIADYVDETNEIVHFEITGSSEGLIKGDMYNADVIIENKVRFQEDNRAILFDGVDDYIDLGDIYDNVTLPVTISAWVFIDPTAAAGLLPIFDSQDNLPVYNGFNFITTTSSSVGVQYGDGQGENNIAFRRAKSSTFSPITGRWISLTGIMRSATDMDLYVNGVNVGGNYDGTSNLPLHSSSPNEVAKIGVINQNGQVFRFKGKIDEVKIWNRALTEGEVQMLIFKKVDNTATGLIGYWSFDEPDGTIVNDASSNKFNGTLKGNPVRVHSESPVSK